jgi:fructose-1,6-bisphosphatase/inositol monophosphatase family enzyme
MVYSEQRKYMKQNITTTADGKSLGTVIREAMNQAIAVIRTEAATFIATPKEHYSGTMDDVVTSADKAAQKVYVDAFEKAFPGYGFIGEENGMNTPCTIPGENIYVTCDPLDGTKAFVRQESQGVGSMLAVVRNGVVIAAYVGDVNTGEIYGFDPEHPTPTRTRFGVTTDLVHKTDRPLHTRYILLNTPSYRFPKPVQKFILTPEEGGLFSDTIVTGGSYGITLARLWKNEVALVLKDPAFRTPWDETPILGMNQALGIVTIKIDPVTCAAELLEIAPPTEVCQVPHIEIMAHKDHAPAILEWFAKNVERTA